MRAARVAAAMVPVLAAAGGCTALFPLGDLAGGTPDASVDSGVGGGGEAAVETGADASLDTGVSDATADAMAVEAGDSAPVDAPSDVVVVADVAVEAEASSPPFCASLSPKPVLCEDFDEGTAFNAQFSGTFTAIPANLGADGAFFRSPPDSLFSKINAGASTGNTYEYMQRDFTGTSTRIEYAFDLLLQQTVSGHEAVVAMIVVSSGAAAEHDVALVLGNLNTMEQSFVGDAGTMLFLDTSLAASPSPGVWSHVDLVVSLAQRTMTVTVDGAAALTAAPLDPSWPTSGPISVRLGISYANDTSTPWVVRYDDVTANPQ